MARLNSLISSPIKLVLIAITSALIASTSANAERLGTPIAHEGNIYLGSDSGSIRAIRMDSKELLWTYKTGKLALLRPVIYGEQLFIGGESGFMHALDLHTGKENWKFETGRVKHPIRDRFVNNVPKALDDVLYFTSEDFQLYAVDINSGEEIWRFNLGEEVQQVEIPMTGGQIFVGSWNGHIFAVDAKTGKEVWRSETNNYHKGSIGFFDGDTFTPADKVPEGERKSNQVPFVTVSPIFDDEQLYFVDWSGNLFGIDIKTGKQVIRFKPDTVNMEHVGSRYYMSQTTDKIVYATLEDRHVYSVDKKTGKVIDRLTFDGWIEGPIPASGRYSFLVEYTLSHLGSPNGLSIHGFDLEEMKILYTIEDAAFFPFAQNNVFFLSKSDGTIEKRDLQTGALMQELSISD
jgi:outer membrane protein assembly factor BamB